jgi:hypothetical protein
MSYWKRPIDAAKSAVARADDRDDAARHGRSARRGRSSCMRAIEVDARGDHRGRVDERGDRASGRPSRRAARRRAGSARSCPPHRSADLRARVPRERKGWLGLHVRRRVDVDQRADARDDQGHHRGERVHREREVDAQRADAHHLPAEAVERAVLGLEREQLREVRDHQQEGPEHRADGHGAHAEATDVELLREVLPDRARLEFSAKNGVHRRADERQERDEPQGRERGLEVRDRSGELGHGRAQRGAEGLAPRTEFPGAFPKEHHADLRGFLRGFGVQGVAAGAR